MWSVKESMITLRKLLADGYKDMLNDMEKQSRAANTNKPVAAPQVLQPVVQQQIVQDPLELSNLASYALRGVKVIPSYTNLETNVSKNALQPQKMWENLYRICLYKRERDLPISHAERARIKDILNSGLGAARFDAEKEFMAERDAAWVKLSDLTMEAQCNPNPCKNYDYEAQKIQRAYGAYFGMHSHLLLGLEATDIQDFPDHVEIIMQCDPGWRIDPRL